MEGNTVGGSGLLAQHGKPTWRTHFRLVKAGNSGIKSAIQPEFRKAGFGCFHCQEASSAIQWSTYYKPRWLWWRVLKHLEPLTPLIV